MCEGKRRDGRILYLVLCNGKWLKVVWNQTCALFLLICIDL